MEKLIMYPLKLKPIFIRVVIVENDDINIDSGNEHADKFLVARIVSIYGNESTVFNFVDSDNNKTIFNERTRLDYLIGFNEGIITPIKSIVNEYSLGKYIEEITFSLDNNTNTDMLSVFVLYIDINFNVEILHKEYNAFGRLSIFYDDYHTPTKRLIIGQIKSDLTTLLGVLIHRTILRQNIK